jgi:TM2 domain-containing membrane protein YozV
MKTCPYCAQQIQDAALVCRFCDARLDSAQASRSADAGGGARAAEPQVVVVATPAWRPGVAALLSFLIPGAGQIYKGQTFQGIVWLVCVVVGYVFILPGLILHLLCIVAAGSGRPPLITATGQPTTAAGPSLPSAPSSGSPVPVHRATTTNSLIARGLVVVLGLVALLVIAVALWPARTRPALTGEAEHRAIYNGILRKQSFAALGQRYGKPINEIEDIEKEGQARGWTLEGAGPGAKRGADGTAAPHAAPGEVDELTALITQFGRPDGDVSSETEVPRPPIVTRQLTFTTAHLRAVYRANVTFGAPPPYAGTWKLVGFVDTRSNQKVDDAEARSRLAARQARRK